MLRILDELQIVGVWDRGIPNKERIAIKTYRTTNLVDYFLFLGVPVGNQTAVPLTDNVLHLGQSIMGVIEPPTWVIVYTGPGETKLTTIKPSGESALVLHWGKKETALHNPNVVPVLLSAEGIFVSPHSGILHIR